MTILYLKNKYITSCDELKKLVLDSSDITSPVCREILAALKDGTIRKWMAEGNTTEQRMAARLPQGGESYCNDSELMKLLGECFSTDYSLKPLDLDECLKLEKIEANIGKTGKQFFEPTNIPSLIKCFEFESPTDIKFCFLFKILKQIGEVVTFKLRVKNLDTKEIIESSPKQIRIDYIREQSYQLNLRINDLPFTPETHYELQMVASFMKKNIVLGCLRISNVFQVPSIPLNIMFKLTPKERLLIEIIQNSFRLCKAGWGTYKIFDGNAHDVYINKFFISTRVISQNDYGILTGLQEYHDNRDMDLTYLQAEKFIQKLNQITGLHYFIPSEAQWQRAVEQKLFSPRWDDEYEHCSDYVFDCSNMTPPTKKDPLYIPNCDFPESRGHMCNGFDASGTIRRYPSKGGHITHLRLALTSPDI